MHARVFSSVMVSIFLGLWAWFPAYAGEYGPVEVVTGTFLYEQVGLRSGRPLAGQAVQYQVRAAIQDGIPAWCINMKANGIETALYIRRDNGAPLYLKRINHTLQRTVEIRYSLSPGKASIYRRFTRDEDYQRKIRVGGLTDIGMVPQMLLGMVGRGVLKDMHFKSIDYKTGNVYDMVAIHAGFKRLAFHGQRIRCAIYDIKIDSWISVFSRRIRLVIPMSPGLANFFSYDGPALTGSGSQVSLRLTDRDTRLAVNKR